MLETIDLDEEEFEMVVDLVDSLYSGRHFSGNPIQMDTAVNNVYPTHLQGKGRDLLYQLATEPNIPIYAYNDVIRDCE